MSAELVERLRRIVAEAEAQGLADESPVWVFDDGEWFSVSDVREAADTILSLSNRVRELEKQRLIILAAVYAEAPRFVAKICDESLDRSGALLGQVREIARAALHTSEMETK